jgi:spore coat protein H
MVTFQEQPMRCFVCIVMLCLGLPAWGQPSKVKDASDAFFDKGMIPRLSIEVTNSELDKLRQRDREYVKCTVVEDGKTRYEDVGIHLKGAAGSFRGFDDRPALSLNFSKFKKQKFHDLDKIHLNNSVQDPSYLSELICGELFLAQNVPTARTTHCFVKLNGRDIGFYVLKEGYNTNFLKRYFDNPSGNLYDGGFLQEIDAELKLMNGEGAEKRADLKELVKACREPNQELRWKRLNELLDVERFITFMALEHMTCDWDGYCQQRNNYRIYFDPKSGKAVFIPHGMDQMFGDPNYPITHVPQALVASAVMNNPAWRARYRERINELMPKFSPATYFHQRIDELVKRLQPEIAAWNKQAANDFIAHVAGLKERIRHRAIALERLNAVQDPKPFLFDANGIAVVPNWEMRRETEAKLERLAPAGQPKSLAITAGANGKTIASWRSRITLPAGTYRFAAMVKGDKIESQPDSNGTGAGIRISGRERTNSLVGTSDWKLISFEFTIDQPRQEVELVAELRATAGMVQFKEDAMRIVRVKK